jgi:hypothetical protein
MIELLLAQVTIPVAVSAEVRYAETLGIAAARFYCYAFTQGAQTPDDIVTVALDNPDPLFFAALGQYSKWTKTNPALETVYLRAVNQTALAYCPVPWRRYLYGGSR